MNKSITNKNFYLGLCFLALLTALAKYISTLQIIENLRFSF